MNKLVVNKWINATVHIHGTAGVFFNRNVWKQYYCWNVYIFLQTTWTNHRYLPHALKHIQMYTQMYISCRFYVFSKNILNAFNHLINLLRRWRKHFRQLSSSTHRFGFNPCILLCPLKTEWRARLEAKYTTPKSTTSEPMTPKPNPGYPPRSDLG